MTYGHHAFTRAATVFFDSPIGEACGLHVDEVTGNSNVWTTDCEGNLLEQLTLVDEVHEYKNGPCP